MCNVLYGKVRDIMYYIMLQGKGTIFYVLYRSCLWRVFIFMFDREIKVFLSYQSNNYMYVMKYLLVHVSKM